MELTLPLNSSAPLQRSDSENHPLLHPLKIEGDEVNLSAEPEETQRVSGAAGTGKVFQHVSDGNHERPDGSRSKVPQQGRGSKGDQKHGSKRRAERHGARTGKREGHRNADRDDTEAADKGTAEPEDSRILRDLFDGAGKCNSEPSMTGWIYPSAAAASSTHAYLLSIVKT